MKKKKMKFILENIKKFEIEYDMIKKLYQMHYLKEFLIELSQIYEDFSIELIYPSETLKLIIAIIESIRQQLPTIIAKIHILIKIFDKSNEKSKSYIHIKT